MRTINPNRKAFIEKVLLDKLWTVKGLGSERVTTLRLSEVSEIIEEMQVGRATMRQVKGLYYIDGRRNNESYGMTEKRL